MNTHYERSIDVEVPASVAYTCWERYQDFPEFVAALDEVEKLAPDRTRWRAHFFAGVDREWTAEITERIPGRRIAWCSRSGTPNAGCVTFHRMEARRTRVMLQIDYLPVGLLAAAGDILRVPQRCIDAALAGFKAYVEGVDLDPDAQRSVPRPMRSFAPPASVTAGPIGPLGAQPLEGA